MAERSCILVSIILLFSECATSSFTDLAVLQLAHCTCIKPLFPKNSASTKEISSPSSDTKMMDGGRQRFTARTAMPGWSQAITCNPSRSPRHRISVYQAQALLYGRRDNGPHRKLSSQLRNTMNLIPASEESYLLTCI